MGRWKEAQQAVDSRRRGRIHPDAISRAEASQMVERALQSKADQYESELQQLRMRAEPVKAYRRPPLEQFLDPRGNGGSKPFGIGYDVLRMFARRNPWVRNAISIRKREVASAGWDIVPDLENHRHELESLGALVRSVHQFPDRADLLQKWEPYYVPADVTQALIEATRSKDLSTAELRTRFYLGLSDLRMTAARNAARVRDLFKRPNNHPMLQWEQILSAFAEDLLSIDVGCLELRRTEFPLAKEFPIEQRVPAYTNRIIELHPVDAATIRPCIDEHGMLRGEEDPYEDAYEQWIDHNQVIGWKRHQLLYCQEHPTTDVHMHGYSFGRVEGLFYTLVLMAKADQADFNEFKRDFFGGFLYLGENGDMESLEELRTYIEEELEGDKKIPLLAGFPKDAKYIPTTGGTASKDSRRTERQREFLHRVAAAFEMPLLKLSIADSTNYRNSDVGSDMMDDGLRSLCGTIDRSMTYGIVSQTGHTDIAYRTAPHHSRDREKQLENIEKELELGLCDINDGRIELGRQPTEDGERTIHSMKAYEEAKGRAQGAAAAGVDVDPTTPEIEQDGNGTGDGKGKDGKDQKKNPTPPPNPGAPGAANKGPKGSNIPPDVERNLTEPVLTEAKRYHAAHGRWPSIVLSDDDTDD